jgi:hypothetical protein
MSRLSLPGAYVPVGGNLALWLRSAAAVEHKVGKRGVAMPEQTKTARIGAVNPPFLFASIDLAPNPGTDPKSNNVKVIVEGLKGRAGVGRLRQAFLQVRQADAVPVHPDHFTLQVVEVGRDYLVFRIRRVDANSGWHQPLRIQMLLIADPED